MSRFMVQGEFVTVSKSTPSAEKIKQVGFLLNVHAGDVFIRPCGWTMSAYIGSSPGPAEAGHTAGEIFREAARKVGLPEAIMTDIHIRRIGGWALKEEEK